MRKSCVIYATWADQILNLPDDIAGQYAKTILRYAIYGEGSEMDNTFINAMFIPVKKKLDEDIEKYQEKVERMNTCRNHKDIYKKSDSNLQEITSDTDTVTDTVTDTDTDKDIKDKRKPFIKPTVEEVKAYCKERDNKVDPYQFVDFYESKGWKVGNQPMKDWKAAVRTWEKRDSGKSSPSKTPYKGRTYDFKALEGEFLGNVRQE